MFNSTFIENAAPAGFGVLELIATSDEPTRDTGLIVERPPRAHWTPAGVRRSLAALDRTTLRGTITGPLASLRLVQRFRVPLQLTHVAALEARYRFPLPGDAAVLGVVVRFGDAEVRTTLAAREEARATYDEARAAGHQAALLEREAPNVFTLSLAGLRGSEAIEVETQYVQRAALAGGRWSVRVPLTTAPRFVRADELDLPQAQANPLAVLRDPGHRFALDVTLTGAAGPLAASSPTHPLRVETVDGGLRVRLRDDEVVPDRDCVLEWRTTAPSPALHVVSEESGAHRYVMALVTPQTAEPSAESLCTPLPRDLLLLVDRSGSMEGAKWEATRWAVRRACAALAATDRVQLGLFDDTTVWLDAKPLAPSAKLAARVDAFLDRHGPNGGTELGVALEGALLGRPRVAGDDAARHCLIVTDGQVTDEGRILALLDAESARPDARRVSVLCIDSAPNASLATAVAERGRGSAHYLSSDPSDGDVATALEDVLEALDAPLAVGLSFGVDGVPVESPSRPVIGDGAESRVDLGDLVVGRPAWVVVRVPAGAAGGATVTVRGRGLATLRAPLDGTVAADAGVRAAFGAERVRVLEGLVSTADPAAAAASLRQLGYDATALGIPRVARDGLPAASTTYAENATLATRAALRALLVRESLDAGVPSTATSFVAVHRVAGQVVERTVDVASALPAGWSGAFEDGAFGGAVASAPSGIPRMMRSRAMPAPVAFELAEEAEGSVTFSPAPPPPAAAAPRRALGGVVDALKKIGRPRQARGGDVESPPMLDDDSSANDSVTLWDGVPSGSDEIVLFDSDDTRDVVLPAFVLRALVGVSGDAGAVPNSAQLFLYVGDLARPVARVALAAALVAGGERPLNVRCAGGERVRLVLRLDGTWPSSAGALRVALGG